MEVKKKGLSQIVAVVFIILLVVASISIFWLGILPLIQGRIQIEKMCLDAEITTSLQETCISASEESIYNEVFEVVCVKHYTEGQVWPYNATLPGTEADCSTFITDYIEESYFGSLDLAKIDIEQHKDDLDSSTVFAINSIQVLIKPVVKRAVSSSTINLIDLQFGGFREEFGVSETFLFIGNIAIKEDDNPYTLADLPQENEQKTMAFQFPAFDALQYSRLFIAPVVEYEGNTRICGKETMEVNLDLCPGTIPADEWVKST